MTSRYAIMFKSQSVAILTFATRFTIRGIAVCLFTVLDRLSEVHSKHPNPFFLFKESLFMIHDIILST